MSEARIKVERVIALTDRLADMLGADVAALERGQASELKTNDPTVQQLTMLYAREAAGVNAAVAKAVPPELRQKLAKSTKRMNDTLAKHQRIITRVRNASEGMIRAVAQEVERRRGFQRNYARTPSARPQSTGSLLYNSVI
ncbi:MAG TPA: hypothetical protein VIJ85_06420 [Rhizomicrobium sp.]